MEIIFAARVDDLVARIECYLQLEPIAATLQGGGAKALERPQMKSPVIEDLPVLANIRLAKYIAMVWGNHCTLYLNPAYLRSRVITLSDRTKTRPHFLRSP